MNNLDLCTVIQNTSGSPMYFPFLGIDGRGRDLADDETYTFLGTWEAAIRSMDAPGDGIASALYDFAEKLIAGDITLVRVPAPLYMDTLGTTVFKLRDNAGTPDNGTPSFLDAGADEEDGLTVEGGPLP